MWPICAESAVKPQPTNQPHSCNKITATGGSRGRRLGQLPRAPREGGTKEGTAKITRICMTKNVIDFIILNNQMFRINDIDIQHKSAFSSIALIAVIM